MMTTDADFSDENSDIAIIGMAGRFPAAPDLATFWSNICQGRESIAWFSPQEMLAAGIPAELFYQPGYVRAGAILDDIELFDAAFFHYLPTEARTIDPQQRLFLECAWQALEHAGYDTDTYPGSIGVYAGTGLDTYLLFYLQPHYRRQDLAGAYQIMIGNDKDFLATRVSYKCNLKGPGVAVQTACSTSLVAVHLACQSLLNGECDIALAGGVSIALPQKTGYLHQPGMILSPDGHCRAFDARAQGTVPGSGLGVVVLKRLREALADGDSIHALIKGSAVNNDGASKIGFTTPCMESQRDVIIQARTMARVPVETITYIEAHGTGTPLGDPIEIEALTQAFQVSTAKKQFCALGSVKTNIGHLDAASGIAGLLKTVCMLKYKQIPPVLHFREANPHIDFAHSAFYINTEIQTWSSEAAPLRAGVSSFGIGGTNAHVILEQAPPARPASPSRTHQILVLSANSRPALEQIAHNLADYLQQQPDNMLADTAYTLQVGRKRLSHRRILVCTDREEALHLLKQQEPEQTWMRVQEAHERPVTFLFPGQGCQYVGMGRQLYIEEPVFRQTVDQVARLFQAALGDDLRTLLYPTEDQEYEADRRLQQTHFAQPALFTLEYALAQLWQSWGIHPQAMLGHSIGEYVAACLAGVLSLEDAVTVVAIRGQLMQKMPPGAMLAINLAAEDVHALLGTLSIAAINGEKSCVVAGAVGEIEHLRQRLERDQVVCSLLQTSHAFHSAMMEPIVEQFVAAVRRVPLKPPQVPYISNVTGNWIQEEQATNPDYWGQHLRQPVRFAEGIRVLQQRPEHIFLEVGPGRVLSMLLRQATPRSVECEVFASLRSPRESQPDLAVTLHALGGLWLAGAHIDWAGFTRHERRQRLPLPTYPFERQRHWVDLPETQPDRAGEQTQAAPGGKHPDRAAWFYRSTWQKAFLLPDERTPAFSGSWLIFADASGLGERVAALLRDMGQRVTCVVAGELFAYEQANQRYTLREQEPDDYVTLCNSLIEHALVPDAILYCWPLSVQEKLALDPSSHQSLEKTFYSLLFLVQALGRRILSKHHLQMILVSTSAYAITGQETLAPEQALVLGACRVLPQEYLSLTCRTVDLLCSPQEDWATSPLPAQVLAECVYNQHDLQVAYRGQGRWIQTYTPQPLPPVQQATTVLRPGGVYLICGGMGNIGLTLAEYLARTVQARIVLVGRTALPAEHEWQTWLTTHDQEDETSQKIHRLQAILEAGGKICICQADIAHKAQMQAVIARASATFGTIHGVIHAAGINTVQAFKAIQETQKRDCDAHFRAKVSGTLVLEDVLRGSTLDFCLFCSSLSAILGGIASVAYTAANSFLDAFAQQQRQRGNFPWISVDWDTWRGAERQHALTAKALAMTPEEATDAFLRVLASNSAHLINSLGDLDARLRQWIYLETVRGQASTHTSLSHHFAEAHTIGEYEQSIAAIWQEVLGIEHVGPHDNFFELGGTSLIGLTLVARLQETSGKEISAVRLFEAPTVHTLASLLYQEQTPDSYQEDTRRGKLRKEHIRRRLQDHQESTPPMRSDGKA